MRCDCVILHTVHWWLLEVILPSASVFAIVCDQVGGGTGGGGKLP